MLKKLFAHEWKDTWKLLTLINCVMFILAISGMFIFNSRNAGRVAESAGDGAGVAMAIGYTSYFFVYAVGIGILSFGTMLYFFVRFYRNLYTDQGYLMHTLPVTTHQLILSKTFVAMIWRLISSFVLVFSIVAIIFGLMPESPGEVIHDIFDGFTVTGVEGILLLLLIFLGCIGSMLFQTFMGYLAISIGQQLGKNKVLASIGVYFGIQVVINIVWNIFSQTLIFSAAANDGFLGDIEPTTGMVLTGMLIADLIVFAICYGMYVLIHHFMKKKLNLD